MLTMVNGEPPLLVRVTFCAALVTFTFWFPKLKLAGENEAVGAPDPVPVPVREAVCGLPGALSVMERVELRVPDFCGVKVTTTMQFAPGATSTLQSLVCEKSPLLPVEMVTPV